MSKRSEVIDRIVAITGNKKTADMVMDMLEEEGVLHLGYGNAEIDKVADAFKKAFGSTKTTRYERFAINRLVKAHNAKSIVGIIEALAKRADEQYAPTVNSLVELENKLPSVLRFLRTPEQGTGKILDVEV